MSQERPDRPVSNREEVERRLKAACGQLDEPYTGYRDHMYELALKAVGLVAMHSYEPISDVNKQLFELVARAGDIAHAKSVEAGEVAQ